MNRVTRIVFLAVISLALVALIAQLGFAGPGCSKSCEIKGCANATATKAAATDKETVKAEFASKEECIAHCMAQGMSKEEAEACWEKHCATGNVDAKAGCPAHATTATKASATGCPSMKGATATTGSTPACCASKTTAVKANATDSKAACTASCTKEVCVDKLKAAGLSQEEAEAKYAACHADGNCSGKDKGVCCADELLKKTSPQ